MNIETPRINAMQAHKRAQEEVTGTVLGQHYWIVYAIAASDDGPTKIGITQSLEERVAGLQIGNWAKLYPFGFRLALPKSGGTLKVSMAAALKEGAIGIERQAHARLKDLGFHISGEWFDVSPAEALAVVDKIGAAGHIASISLEALAVAESNAQLDRGMRAAHMKLLRAMATVSVFINRQLAGEPNRAGLTDD